MKTNFVRKIIKKKIVLFRITSMKARREEDWSLIVLIRPN